MLGLEDIFIPLMPYVIDVLNVSIEIAHIIVAISVSVVVRFTIIPPNAFTVIIFKKISQ